MELKPTLKTAPAVSQQLVLSPRLYQSLSILRLAVPELQELIQRELDENPTLEIPEPSDFDSQADGQTVERELWEDYQKANRGDNGAGFEGGAIATQVGELTPSPVTLTDHLTLQLDLENLTDEYCRIGLAIIGSLDEDGYLREPLGELAATIDRPADKVEEVLAIVQHFDPPGVAARSLQECLVIQLEQIAAGEIAIRIAREFMPQVARGAYGETAKQLSVTAAKVRHIVGLLRQLRP